MASPQPSTYHTQRLPLVGGPEARAAGSTKDQRLVNCYSEEVKSVMGDTAPRICQRPGLSYLRSTTAGTARGIYYYNGSTFSVVGNQLYRDGAAIQTLSTSTGTVGFQEYAGAAKYLIVLDGVSGWTISATNVVVQITDVDFPTPHVPQAAYIDGYLIVAKSGTADLYNSVLDDPFSWNAGDFITAEMFPDNVVATCRQNNYVVALGQQTMEFFYDTGAFPGTPLARNPAALHQIGCVAPDTLVQVEEQVIFVGQTAEGGRSIWVLNSFTPTEISSEPIKQSLDAEGTNISNAKAFCVRSKGHRFYVLNLTSKTWVFDFEENMWTEWADNTGATKFPCDYASDYPTAQPVLQDRTTGYQFNLNPTVSTDATGPASTANITSYLVTIKHDFGTMNRKFMHRFSLVADVPAASGAASFTLEWSDDDYQTWSTARTVVLGDTMPTTTQLGSFRRRAFRLTYAQPYVLRIDGAEVDINMGSK
jgi:hypothetical protein